MIETIKEAVEAEGIEDPTVVVHSNRQTYVVQGYDAADLPAVNEYRPIDAPKPPN